MGERTGFPVDPYGERGICGFVKNCQTSRRSSDSRYRRVIFIRGEKLPAAERRLQPFLVFWRAKCRYQLVDQVLRTGSNDHRMRSRGSLLSPPRTTTLPSITAVVGIANSRGIGVTSLQS